MSQAPLLLGPALGASESFEELFRCEHAKLLRALYVVTGDRYSAEEAAQGRVRALSTLTHRQRAALVLTEMLGFDSETAGRLLGVKAVTARTLVSKGRTALRAALEGYDG